MLLSFLEERDIPRRGREARDWLVADGRDVARRGREARDWLTTDERGRVVGLVIASVAISILVSLLATALVGYVERRRAAAADDAAVETADEPVPEREGVGVPVREAAPAAADPAEVTPA
jgi:hypothetical protein